EPDECLPALLGEALAAVVVRLVAVREVRIRDRRVRERSEHLVLTRREGARVLEGLRRALIQLHEVGDRVAKVACETLELVGCDQLAQLLDERDLRVERGGRGARTRQRLARE